MFGRGRIHQRVNLISSLFFSLAAIILLAGGGIALYSQQSDSAGSRAALAAGALSQKVEKLLRLELGLGDFLDFNEQCAEVVENDPLLAGAAVFTNRWELLYGTQETVKIPVPRRAGENFLSNRILETSSARFAVQPIKMPDGATAGYAVAFIRSEAVLFKTVRSLVFLFMGGLVLLVLILGVQNRIFWHLVGAPLAEMVAAADSLDADRPEQLSRFSALMQRKNPPDINSIYEALHRLFIRLQEARGELLRQNENLETLVKIRTEQLEYAKILLEEDIDRRKNLEDELRSIAERDTLTGLLNRRSMEVRTDSLLSRAGNKGSYSAMLYIDLDHFKEVNDRMGHEAGDRLLMDVSRRLASAVRDSDVVARIGGDEFVIVLGDLPDSGLAAAIAEEIRISINLPFVFENTEVFVSPSIGVSIFPDDGKDMRTLLKKADAAMYAAKSRGRNTCCRFSGKESPVREKRDPFPCEDMK